MSAKATKTTTQKLAELKTLSQDADDNLYARLRLANDVMNDHGWIASNHDGSDTAALDYLEQSFFAHLGGFVSLGRLLKMYRDFDYELWKLNKFNIHAMLEEESPSESNGSTKREYINWKAKFAEAEQTIKRMERELAILRGRLASCDMDAYNEIYELAEV